MHVLKDSHGVWHTPWAEPINGLYETNNNHEMNLLTNIITCQLGKHLKDDWPLPNQEDQPYGKIKYKFWSRYFVFTFSAISIKKLFIYVDKPDRGEQLQ